MFDDARNELAVLDDRLDLFRYRLFFENALFFALDGQADVERARFGRNDFDRQRIFRQVNLSTVRAVDLERRYGTYDLDRERGRSRNGEGRNERIDEQRQLATVDDRDGVDFASNDDGRVLDVVNVDDLVQFGLFDGNVLVVFEILDRPFVAFEDLLGRLGRRRGRGFERRRLWCL